MDNEERIEKIEQFLKSVPGDYGKNTPANTREALLIEMEDMLKLLQLHIEEEMRDWRVRLESLHNRLALCDPEMDAANIELIETTFYGYVHGDPRMKQLNKAANKADLVNIAQARIQHFNQLATKRQLTESEMKDSQEAVSLVTSLKANLDETVDVLRRECRE